MSHPVATPIPTFYKGYHFRSRLEARWAVWLDALEIRFRYEVEGFEIGGTRYLPDFFIDDSETFLEVKPTHDFEGTAKAHKLAKSGRNIVVFTGDVYTGHWVWVGIAGRGLLPCPTSQVGYCHCKSVWLGIQDQHDNNICSFPLFGPQCNCGDVESFRSTGIENASRSNRPGGRLAKAYLAARRERFE